ncbi:MAG TPA: molybdopterin-dependent oxidoreductase, partial [Leptospiraceae bacterium]|nr:molybdopterin-dependent oxidoreductase [Leptospiraceae bacterium]
KPTEQIDFLLTKDNRPNTKGAVDSGFISAGSLDSVRNAWNSGNIDVLFLLNEELPEGFQKKGTVIALNTNITESVKTSDFAVPVKAFTEQTGSFTNKNGVRQNFELAMNPILGLPSSGDFFRRLGLELSRKKEEVLVGNR